MARGAVIIAARKNGLDMFEYSPTTAKKAVVGSGSASKQQVQAMVQRLLGLSQPPPEDAADALSLAICHAQRCNQHVSLR
jgi:crossover junction endodeoxyribonuclease RuvC